MFCRTKADCSDIVPLDTATVVSFFYALSSPAREAIISRVQRCRSRIREAISLWTLRLRSRRLQERGQSLTRARQQRQVAHCFHLWHVELKSLVLERAVALSQNLRILHRSFYLWKQQQLTRARGRLAVSALNRFLSTRLVRRYWTVWSVQYAKQRQYVRFRVFVSLFLLLQRSCLDYFQWCDNINNVIAQFKSSHFLISGTLQPFLSHDECFF